MGFVQAWGFSEMAALKYDMNSENNGAFFSCKKRVHA